MNVPEIVLRKATIAQHRHNFTQNIVFKPFLWYFNPYIMALIPRPPVVVILGHIDHGKSTLLDYIRKSNVADGEVGGITQKMTAYEINHVHEGKDQRITFIDTPGHEAFQTLRGEGARVGDIAVLVVSAEDGVKPQTLEALKAILEAKIPYIVAINKIDKPTANVEKTKQTLAEHDILIESWGGKIPAVNISAKTGEGVPELLDTILLAIELEQITYDPKAPATGIVIEAHRDKQKGISATLIIKNGSIETGMFIIAGKAFSPVRLLENFAGKKIAHAEASSPVQVIGFTEIPNLGSPFVMVKNKKEAEEMVKQILEKEAADAKALKIKQAAEAKAPTTEQYKLPIIIRADSVGVIDAIKHELGKITTEHNGFNILMASVGEISESDVKTAMADPQTVVVGFNSKIDKSAADVALKHGVVVQTFDIIYKLGEWMAEHLKKVAPKKMVLVETGKAKILKIFSVNKDKQIMGGRVENGKINLGSEVIIKRRDVEIGKGRIRELQQAKNKTSEVEEGNEFGTMIESKTTLAPGDHIIAMNEQEVM